MKSISLRKAKETLSTLVEEVAQGEPVYIHSKGKSVVLGLIPQKRTLC